MDISSYKPNSSVEFRINNTCDALTNNKTSSFTQPQLQLKKTRIEKQYYDKKRGEFISEEDYWAKRNFKAQPGYILGKLLRKSVLFSIEKIGMAVSSIFDYVSSFEWFSTEESFSFQELFPLSEDYQDILNNNFLLGKSTLINQMYQENKKFASFCQKEFIQLVKNHQKDNNHFSKIAYLTEIGIFSIDAYWWALHHQDEKILKLFFTKKEINDVIEGQDLFGRFEEMNKGLAKNYKMLESKINEAILLAEKHKMPLMTLLGENHNGYQSSFPNEIMALEILAEKLPNLHFVSEAPLQLCKFRNPLATEEACKFTFHDFVEKKAKELGLKQTPVDCLFYYEEACKKKDESACIKEKKTIEEYAPELPTSVSDEEEKRVKIRNLIMEKMTLHSTKGHVVGIFGAAHIYGFLKETAFPKHFYILSIDTTSAYFSMDISDYSTLCQSFLRGSEDVFSVPEITQIGIPHKEEFEAIPAEIIIEKAHAIHARAIQTAFNLKRQNKLEDNIDLKQHKKCKKREVTDKRIVIDF